MTRTPSRNLAVSKMQEQLPQGLGGQSGARAQIQTPEEELLPRRAPALRGDGRGPGSTRPHPIFMRGPFTDAETEAGEGSGVTDGPTKMCPLESWGHT